MGEILRISLTLMVLFVAGQPGGPESSTEQQPREPGLLGPKIDLKSVDTSNWAVKDGKASVERVERVLGVKPGLYPGAAELVRAEHDNTPYLSNELVNKPFWQVVVREWAIEPPSTLPGFRDLYLRTLDVLVNPMDGRVMKIKSRWPKSEPPMDPEPSAASATEELRRSGAERYHEIPKNDPRVTFLDALDSIQRGGQEALAAKQITAYHVVWSDVAHTTPRPVWAVIVRGVMPVKPLPEMPLDRRYEYRLIVDAETGEFLCGTGN